VLGASLKTCSRNGGRCHTYTVKFLSCDECRIKQQETEQRLEESLSHISRLEASHTTMQASYATMQASHATMQAQLDSIILHIQGLENLSYPIYFFTHTQILNYC